MRVATRAGAWHVREADDAVTRLDSPVLQQRTGTDGDLGTSDNTFSVNQTVRVSDASSRGTGG